MNRYVQKDAALNADGTEGKIAQGRMAYAQGKYQESVDLITQGLARFSTNAVGWTYLAEAYLAMNNRTADAKNAIAKALDIDPTNGYANRAMAQIVLAEADEKAAEKYVTAAFRALPGDAWLKRQMQLIKERTNPSTGITSREKHRRDRPDDLENLVLLARLYADAKVAQYDKAAEVYKEALKVSKNDLRLAREVARFFGREEVNRPQEGDDLLMGLMNAEQDKARKAQVAVCLGQFHEVRKTLATADRYFRMAVSLDPANDILNAAGEFYARTNRYRDAAEYYGRLMKQTTKPEDAELHQTTHARIIALWLALGDLDNAKKEIEAFSAAYPNNPQGLIFAGAYHRIGGDIQKAKEAFDAHLEKDANNATALWQRGQMYMLMGKWQSALDDLRKSKTFAPEGFGYQHRIAMAQALVEMGRSDEAIVELRSILDQKPDETAVAEALIDVYSRARPPKYSEAENVIYTYMRLYPKDFKWPMFLGRLGERMQKWDKALQGYERAAELARENREVLARLFNAYKQAGKPKEMTEYLATKISERQLERMPLQRAGIGWAYHQIGMRDKAVEAYDLALSAAGEDFLAYTRVVGEMVSVLGLKDALARARARADSDPQNIEKQKAMVHLLQMDGQPDEALAYCEKVAKLAVRDADLIFAHLAQGMLLEQSGRRDEAKGHYEAALKLDPNQPIALNNMAYLLADRLNLPSEALPYAQRAAKADTNNADVLDTLGYILFLNGRMGEALGALLRAKELERENVAVLYHLGLAYQKKGDAEEARQWLDKAKDAAANSEAGKRFLPKIVKALGEEKS
jgi:tetratricopeptide (TPR) repeat protein